MGLLNIYFKVVTDFDINKSNEKSNMQTEAMNCCICKKHFTENSYPRMMPSCQHSACTLCIKQYICRDKIQVLVCQHCGNQQKLEQVDIQYFPKNISLTKLVKEKNNNSTQNLSSNNSSSRDTVSSINQVQVQKDFCQQHKKNLEIICLNDRVKLCAHCAIFGTHKDHQFKTINEVNNQIDSRLELFKNYKCKKSALDSKLNSNEFKESIVRKIGQQKDRLILDIKKKFSKISDNIKLAQKKAYQDVVKNFKLIYSKISALIKQENQSQKKFKLWELKCIQLFDKAQKMKRIEDKVALYYDGPLQICKQGQSLLNRIQTKVNSNISTIETLISQIKIIENNGICNSVFNYVNIVIDENDGFDLLGSVRQQLLYTKQSKNELRIEKLQFGANHLSSDRVSLSPIVKKKSETLNNLNKVSSEKRMAAKSVSTPQRASVNSLVEQFCQRDNLDTLDLTGYSLSDAQIYQVLAYLKQIKKVKGLKLVKNKLTNEGLQRIVQLIPSVTNLNLSFNQLGDESMTTLLNNRPKIPYLRIINLSNNKINERRTKNAIDELKKQGLIVTI